MNMTLFNYKLS